ncbi:hypothetical protein Tco_0611677, partial [Tanacetum coccineum]
LCSGTETKEGLWKELQFSLVDNSKLNVDFQNSPDDEDDTRSSQEYMNDLEEEYQARALLAKSKRDCWSKTLVPSYQSPFQPKLLHSSEHKPEPRSLIAEMYDWDEEEMSSNDNEVTEVKAFMALADEERVSIGKESAKNGESIKIFMKKVHTLLEMEDNDDRKSFLDYLCIDLNYVEEQRNNLMSKHGNLIQELNTCKEKLLVIKQAKFDLFTMQHVNTEILKENQNLRNELKELTSITEAWLNSSNKVNQCISEQILTQKKKILGIDQLTKDTSSSGPKDLLFVNSLEDNSEVSITGSNKPKLFEAEDSTLSNHDTSKHPLPPLEKLTGAELISGQKTIKSILKSKSTFKAETLKGIIINEPSSALVRGNKSSSASKTNSTPSRKLKNVKMEDDPPLAIIMKELNELKLQISKNKSSYFRNKNSQQIEQSKRGILINKERYVKDLLRKYDKIGSSMNTPIVPPNMLGPDLNGKAVNKSQYRGMIGSLMNLTASRHDIQFSTSLYASTNKQQSVAMFSAEAEDIAVAGCCYNILWIKSQLTEYDIIYEKLLDKPSFKRLIDEQGMLNIDSKRKASVLIEEN